MAQPVLMATAAKQARKSDFRMKSSGRSPGICPGLQDPVSIMLSELSKDAGSSRDLKIKAAETVRPKQINDAAPDRVKDSTRELTFQEFFVDFLLKIIMELIAAQLRHRGMELLDHRKSALGQPGIARKSIKGIGKIRSNGPTIPKRW